MLLTLIAVLFTLLLAAYLAYQGALSALLAFASALFASFTAVGFYELLAQAMYGWRPDHARGVMFLGLFFLSFSLFRIIADTAVKQNIILPAWLDRPLGGLVGVFAGILIAGTTITGIEMLPLPETIVGAGSVPSVADSSDTKSISSSHAAASANLAEAAAESAADARPHPDARAFPARFATAILYAGSENAIGGGMLAQSFTSVHPDFGAELVGYRHIVQYGSCVTLSQNLLDVRGAYFPTAERIKALHISAPGSQQVLIVRTAINKGSTRPAEADDTDGSLRLSTTQVRLVVLEPNGRYGQVYPIGYLEHGTTYAPLSVAVGHIVDDFNPAGFAVYDWVFAVDEGAKPTLIEIKQCARGSLVDKISPKPFGELAKADYPPHLNRPSGSLQIGLPKTGDMPMGANAPVWILLGSGVPRADVSGAVARASDILEAKARDWGDNTGGHGGVPTVYDFNQQITRARDNINLSKEDIVQWTDVVQVLLTAQLTKDGQTNLNTLPEYFNSTIAPMLDKAPNRVGPHQTDERGQASTSLLAGTYLVVATRKNDTAFRVWMRTITIAKDAKVVEEFRDGPIFVVDRNK